MLSCRYIETKWININHEKSGKFPETWNNTMTTFNLQNTMLFFLGKHGNIYCVIYIAQTEKRSILWTKKGDTASLLICFIKKIVGQYVGKGEFYQHACFH